MKELQDILETFEQIKRSRAKAAIAIVVRTRGSVYRRAGARMLITEAGQMVGAISGGCLESDIVERAQPLMRHNGEPIGNASLRLWLARVAYGGKPPFSTRLTEPCITLV